MQKVHFIIQSQMILYIYTNSDKISLSPNRCQEDNWYVSFFSLATEEHEIYVFTQ